MPGSIGAAGAPYNTKIPLYTENADIQTALRLYHYGEDTDNPGSILSESMVGHLDSLDSSKLDKVPTLITSGADLNSYATTGYYIQTDPANAQSGTNYPTYPNASGAETVYAGLLKVVNSGAIVLQEYHMLGEVGYQVNRTFWRVYFGGSWSSWQQFVADSDVIAITDERYYLKSDVYTKTAANNAFAPKYFLENAKTANHTLVLEDLNKIVSMNVAGGGVLTIPLNTTAAFPIGSVINVYNANPTEFLEITGTTGVVVRNPGTIEPYQEASLRKRATNEWVAAGPIY